MRSSGTLAPEWNIAQWFNTSQPLQLADLRGKVVVIHAFQMLCPGCVVHGLPQTQKIYNTFDANDVAVIGLHTVFEHHEVMTPQALEAFIHEYRYTFPIGVDQPDGQSGPPLTMRAYGMHGTPTLILIDHNGYIRKHSFGRDDDMGIGADIATLISEAKGAAVEPSTPEEGRAGGGGCDEEKCTA
ncbi:alkyl hydroperoxide reductase/ Thiol specific antioxidant/ Mal allergen [Nitrosococcus halophilus Nc 4]|uniref:Alkyl hydroperoxide reductase/ Thiol specific antioxidant/ Mal allergen n=1 Tax=Nitrosococcus halophilus (strain Nc4) TaxID=472759 RepID=D5C4F7_NITHN|nr:TlpA disulfide reductase family protein [Nitrosococcus halophilus]ADE15141.1 alkyl hydroperoxide reductase/ Thiol specific antioxidant/ Mal allergen [Nitrosococcus halophilus Nc 4]